MLTLILGGGRSGKSRYAQTLCENYEKVVYVATAQRDSSDEEMSARIARHETMRPKHWQIIEETVYLAEAIELSEVENSIVMIDCATVWLSNLMWKYRENPPKEVESIILKQVEKLAKASKTRETIIVSNEVGSGIVPMNEVARQFQDLQGFTNQILAREAEKVYLIVAGLPLTLKSPKSQVQESKVL
ncbi:MAG: bifunctional adenosylcobinamide kinase/adenosylcobinamide-phosphate guanylyltransferase [Pyrinomonadaceae bacterium]|nr:bifunctional adenosylcobinamide kinase/adenosylcobinamide-phosphate guanylyltransferase [Pyrinomonadaceae bacterium]